jgi:hypothetical protein
MKRATEWVRRAMFAAGAVAIAASLGEAQAQTALRDTAITLSPDTKLEVINGRVRWVEHRGRRALNLYPLAGQEQGTDQELSAVIIGSDFGDGEIEVDVSGARRAGYSSENSAAFKGFIGVSFHVRGDTAERFYIRPDNARLENQLFRNRSTQYEASPDHPWNRLRQESPGMYESYADLESGGWTRLRIQVRGTTARLYINGASEPALVVTDLKHGASRGAIALWTRISSDAYFSNLRVRSYDLPAISQVINGTAQRAEYRAVPAWTLTPNPDIAQRDTGMFAILDQPAFRNGTIELSVVGKPRPTAPSDSRGFVGVSFRTGPNAEWSEILYLRPTNARADDPVRRARAVQYVSEPEFPWHRLRRERPGVYEAHADMEAGAWTTMKIVVSGRTASLFVNGAAEPALVVTDLKRGDVGGQIALWAHAETEAYFGAVRVTPER